MPGFYKIRYDDGRVVETYGIRGLFYEFPDGETLEVHTEFGWCFHCNAITDIEHLPSIREIDAEIADLQDPNSKLHQVLFPGPPGEDGEFLRSQIAESLRRRDFLRTRTSSAKCVHCGTVNVKRIPFETPFEHPLGAGTFVIDMVGMCSTDFMNWYYTPEGDRIPRDTKPSYWWHPAWNQDETRR